jgi:hypothetical protein
MKTVCTIICIGFIMLSAKAQTAQKTISLPVQTKLEQPSLVDFDAYEKLITHVKKHRLSHLVALDTFLTMSKQKDVIILDTRSDSMYNAKHVKGALHLNFSDFNQYSLARLIPNKKTKILIYCNNNFMNDQVYFISKMPQPQRLSITTGRPLTLALNIPTYINLFGYGYKNVYELSELVSVFNSQISFEGTAVAATAMKK